MVLRAVEMLPLVQYAVLIQEALILLLQVMVFHFIPLVHHNEYIGGLR